MKSKKVVPQQVVNRQPLTLEEKVAILVRKLTSDVQRTDEAFEKFFADVKADPAHAMSWSADLFSRAAEKELAVGWLSGVHCDSLRFAFELLSLGTRTEGAELSIRQTPAVSRCRHCGAATQITEMVIDCPQCGSPEIVIEQGRELLLESIEIDD